MSPGDERRSEPRPVGNTDHDILIEIRSDLKNFMRRFEDHEERDEDRFNGLFKRTSSLQKHQWLFLGGLILFNAGLVIAIPILIARYLR